MGYNISKPELDPYMCDMGTDDGTSSRQKHDEPLNIDHEFFQLTKLQSEPSESLRKASHASRKTPMSTVKMLSGREANSSGKGRFSSADCSHLLGRYLPVNGPWLVDQMDTRSYVSQFSSDGSLFVAGFQGSHIRIYNVDDGWKVQKNILAKSLRWTITDTSLSPDCRFLHSLEPNLSSWIHGDSVWICLDGFQNIVSSERGAKNLIARPNSWPQMVELGQISKALGDPISCNREFPKEHIIFS